MLGVRLALAVMMLPTISADKEGGAVQESGKHANDDIWASSKTKMMTTSKAAKNSEGTKEDDDGETKEREDQDIYQHKCQDEH